mgnify:CR=1 FL=1
MSDVPNMRRAISRILGDPKPQVVLWVKDGCPYSMNAIQFFKNEHRKKIISVNQLPYDVVKFSNELETALLKKYGRSIGTYPKIIVNGVFIGGFSDLIALYKATSNGQ